MWENFAMVMPTPQLATNRHMFGSFSYLLQYLVYVQISQQYRSGCPQCTRNALVGDALPMLSDLTATLNRAFSVICWNNQMSICQGKIDRQNYEWCGHIEVKSCQLAAAGLQPMKVRSIYGVQRLGPGSADTKRAPIMIVVMSLVRCTKSQIWMGVSG